MYFRRPRGSGLAAAVVPLLLAGCSPSAAPAPEAPAAEPQAVAAPPPAPIPAPPPPLGRAELLDAVALAADAAAAGRPYPEPNAALAGRSFRLKLPFGCFGEPAADAQLRYEWNPQTRSLKLSAAPVSWTDVPQVRQLVGDASTEVLEGFWVRRPWLRTGDCPAPPPPPPDPAGPPPAAAPETLGLVSIFGAEDSRVQQRTRRPYEITRKLKDGEAPSSNGYRLVLEGRIGGSETEPPVVCRPDGPDRPPTCFVRIGLDRVAFETPAGEQLAEWAS